MLRGGLLFRLQSELMWKGGTRREVWWTDYCLAVGFCFLAAICSAVVLYWFGVRSGAGGEEILQIFEESPGKFIFLGVFLAPPIEEFFFRVVPRVVASYWLPWKETHWRLGVAVAFVFAFVHLTPTDDSVPAPQFFAGLAFWFIQSKYGFFGSVLVHATYNATVFFLVLAALPSN